MSIADDEQRLPSVTEGDRALELFTDRYSLSRLFVERVNGESAPQEILFFHGPGGNGKSLLLKYLRQNLCKGLRADQWQGLQGLPDDQVVEAIASWPEAERLPVPAALLDFGLVAQDEVRPRDRFYGLLMLRKAFGESAQNIAPGWKLKFPRYDFACIWYLHSKGKSTEEIKALFPLGDAAGLVTTIIDAITQNPAGALVNSVLSLFADDLGEKFAVYLSHLGLKKEEFKRIKGLDIDRELVDELPQFLAADLNAAMAEEAVPKRVVLFFDTHESFWSGERNQPKESYFFQDEWLRRLLRNLDLKQGIVAVVAGRDLPRWAEAKVVKPGTDIPEQYLCCVAVENLAAADARVFLRKVGIGDEALANSLIAYATVVENGVHPLHLGLCADVVLEAEHSGSPLTAIDFAEVPAAFEEKSAQLIERLLRYVDADMRFAIHALTACRAFDFEIYRLLGEKLGFTADRPIFNRLVRFSFVWATEQRGTDWYRIHDLMRRLDDEPEVTEAHGVLLAHYQQEESIEGIYHLNRLDWSKGINSWVERFDQGLELSRYELCGALLDMRQELTIRSDFKLGQISQSEGKYFQNLALYDEAQREFREAIAAYDRDLETDPGSKASLNNKGTALQYLAKLQAALSQHDAAQASYRESTVAYDVALQRAPDDVFALNNKGISLSQLADLQVALSQHNEAQVSYKESIAAYDAALQRAPKLVQALHNKGITLQSLANLQAVLSQHDMAQASCRESVAAHNVVLQCAPDDVSAFNSKGLALSQLANLQAVLSQHDAAQASCKESIAAYDAALQHAPDYVNAFNNKGNSLRTLADLQATLSQQDAAQDSYAQSIAAYDAALQRAPNLVQALNNKGNSLSKLADLQAVLSQHDAAQASYKESIAAFDAALKRAPDYVDAFRNKGNSLQTLANLQAVLSQHDVAQASYKESIAAFDAALQRAPDDVFAFNNKGNSLSKLANLQAVLFQHDAAQASYKESITTFDAALQRAPDFVQALTNKGLTCFNWVLMLMQQQNAEQSDLLAQLIDDALACWNRSLELAPGNSALRAQRDQFVSALEAMGKQANESGDNSDESSEVD